MLKNETTPPNSAGTPLNSAKKPLNTSRNDALREQQNHEQKPPRDIEYVQVPSNNEKEDYRIPLTKNEG